MGLPWWCSGSESVCQYRKHWFSPWSGKIPRTVEQLSPHTTSTRARTQSREATTREAATIRSLHTATTCTQSPEAMTREAAMIRSPHTAAKGSPPATHLEKAQVKQEDPGQPKINKLNFKTKKPINEYCLTVIFLLLRSLDNRLRKQPTVFLCPDNLTS